MKIYKNLEIWAWNSTNIAFLFLIIWNFFNILEFLTILNYWFFFHNFGFFFFFHHFLIILKIVWCIWPKIRIPDPSLILYWWCVYCILYAFKCKCFWACIWSKIRVPDPSLILYWRCVYCILYAFKCKCLWAWFIYIVNLALLEVSQFLWPLSV